ncbi:aldehyde dehydrogenase family protein [Salininema proteolyticum]|uniref:Aldehyde dehydrogenase family protein n=1 Tax=Salininema proteolyticum TaxID=1607685 RepID=A0ABV8U1G8_9ACTN
MPATLNATHSDMESAVSKARGIALWWDEVGFAHRRRHLSRWCAAISNNAKDLARICHRETGKPVPTGVLEIALAVNSLRWAAANARPLLGQRRLRSSGAFPDYTSSLCYRPHGTVAVIGSTDLPLYADIIQVGYALAAGNSVVLKPSEYAPATGQALVQLFQHAATEAPVVRVVHGDGSVGEDLCRSSVDAVSFVGSRRVGRSVMGVCAERLKPLVLQCGGKDSQIVDADADPEEAAASAVYAAFAGSGQASVGIQRAFVHADVYDVYLRRLTQRAARLTVSDDPWADLGPLTKHERCRQLGSAIEEAVENGATAVLGGPEDFSPPYAPPTILVDAPMDVRVMREEVPGPVLCVTRVDSIAEAKALADSTAGGIAASVFAHRNAPLLARTSRTGMTAMNSGLSWATQPALPFGGVAGLGRVGGPDGLRAMARPKAVAAPRPGFKVRTPLFGKPGETGSREVADALVKRLRRRFGRV